MTTIPDSPLYGRKWSISIATNPDGTGIEVSSSDFEPGALRCTFSCEKFYWSTYWFGVIAVYNLNPPTQNQVIAKGMGVKVQAGYVSGNYGTIFRGNVFQPMWDRENVVDFKTILHCIDGLGVMVNSIANLTMQSGYDYAQMVANMAASAGIETGGLMNMGGKTFPRGRVLFGTPDKYMRQVSRDLNAQYWMGDGQLHMGNIIDETTVDPSAALVITPENGLVGTPQMNQGGITFRTLLNPQIVIAKPPDLMMVKLDNTMIRQEKAQLGQIPTLLDQDGIYKVIGVRHSGDTRGNDWYTDVTAVNRAGKLSAMELLAETQN